MVTALTTASKPTISVIVPVYNVESFLPQCIESLQSQTLTDFELILVDDGATDTSSSICDAYARKDVRLKVIHKSNGGLSSARNAGLDLALGDFVAFVDSDDWVEPEYLQTLWEAAVHTNSSVAICGYHLALASGRRTSVPTLSNSGLQIYQGSDVESKFLFPLFGSVPEQSTLAGLDSPSVWKRLYQKKILGGIRFQSERIYLAEDLLFSLDLFPRVERVVICGYHGYNYRYNPASLDRGYRSDRWALYQNLIQYLQARIPAAGIDECKQRLGRRYAESAIFAVWNLFSKGNSQGFYEKKKTFAEISCDVQKWISQWPYCAKLPWNFRFAFFMLRNNLFTGLYLFRRGYVALRGK